MRVRVRERDGERQRDKPNITRQLETSCTHEGENPISGLLHTLCVTHSFPAQIREQDNVSVPHGAPRVKEAASCRHSCIDPGARRSPEPRGALYFAA